MGYMIEGGGSKTMAKTKEWLAKYPKDVHRLLSLLARVIAEYLVMQVEAGAQLLQVFESSADHLTREQFAEVSAPYLKDIRAEVRRKLEEKKLEQVPMVNVLSFLILWFYVACFQLLFFSQLLDINQYFLDPAGDDPAHFIAINSMIDK